MVDDFPINEKVDVVMRPEDVIIGEAGKGIVDGIITSKIIMSKLSVSAEYTAASPSCARVTSKPFAVR